MQDTCERDRKVMSSIYFIFFLCSILIHPFVSINRSSARFEAKGKIERKRNIEIKIKIKKRKSTLRSAK